MQTIVSCTGGDIVIVALLIICGFAVRCDSDANIGLITSLPSRSISSQLTSVGAGCMSTGDELVLGCVEGNATVDPSSACNTAMHAGFCVWLRWDCRYLGLLNIRLHPVQCADMAVVCCRLTASVRSVSPGLTNNKFTPCYPDPWPPSLTHPSMTRKKATKAPCQEIDEPTEASNKRETRSAKAQEAATLSDGTGECTTVNSHNSFTLTTLPTVT